MELDNFKKPKVKILYNGKDKTDELGFISIKITDHESDKSDTLNITLAWDNKRARAKDTITIYIDNKFMGHFIISTIKYNYKKTYEIEATSANFFNGFKEKKNRTFENSSYADIIKSIAKENGYNHKIDFKRASEITTLEQHDLSDSAICKKIADDLALTYCIKNNTLIFIEKDKEYKRIEYSISENDILAFNYEYKFLEVYKSIQLTWFNSADNTEEIITVGKGEPVKKMTSFETDKNEAIKKAQAKLKNQNNSEFKGNLRIHGKAFFAGAFLNIKLNEKPNNLRGIISKITHTITAQGWFCDIEIF